MKQYQRSDDGMRQRTNASNGQHPIMLEPMQSLTKQNTCTRSQPGGVLECKSPELMVENEGILGVGQGNMHNASNDEDS